jgi:uncharacterized RDD family membrane protein YckC
MDYAGWWQRVGALTLDSLVIIAMAALAAALGYLLAGVAGAVVGYVLGGFGGPIVYTGYLHSHHGQGQTLGKRAAGIAVRGIDGGFLGVGPAMGRYAIQIVFGIFYLPALLDYLSAAVGRPQPVVARQGRGQRRRSHVRNFLRFSDCPQVLRTAGR